MAEEYIKREDAMQAVLDSFDRAYGCRVAGDIVRTPYYALMHAPAADVAPVGHGKWEYHSGGNSPIYTMNPEDVYCSVCGFHVDTTEVDFDYYNFCPNCGARMDGE